MDRGNKGELKLSEIKKQSFVIMKIIKSSINKLTS